MRSSRHRHPLRNRIARIVAIALASAVVASASPASAAPAAAGAPPARPGSAHRQHGKDLRRGPTLRLRHHARPAGAHGALRRHAR
jgi:Spy/CpxP family protein refolding chaperone